MNIGYLGSHKAQGDFGEGITIIQKNKFPLNFLFLLNLIMKPATKPKQMPLILFAF